MCTGPQRPVNVRLPRIWRRRHAVPAARAMVVWMWGAQQTASVIFTSYGLRHVASPWLIRNRCASAVAASRPPTRDRRRAHRGSSPMLRPAQFIIQTVSCMSDATAAAIAPAEPRRSPMQMHRCEVAFVGRAAGLTCRSSAYNRVCKPVASPASDEGEAGTACSPSAALYRVTIAAAVSSQHGDSCLGGRRREQRSQQR